MSDMSEEEINARANEKSRKRKEARDRMLATKTIEKGLLIVHTGKGKGKSTAAFGLVMRALGHGMRIGIIQFVKGKWETGDRDVLDTFPDLVTIRTMGEGFTWETQDRARDTCRQCGLGRRQRMIDARRGVKYDLILLDQLNIVLRYDYIPLDEVGISLGKTGRPPCHRDRPKCERAAHRSCRPRDGNDDGKAPLPFRRESPKGH